MAKMSTCRGVHLMRLREGDLSSYGQDGMDPTSPNEDDSCDSDSTCLDNKVSSQKNAPPGSAQNPIYIQDDDADTGHKTQQRVLKLLAEGKLNLNVTPNMKRNLTLAVEIVKAKSKKSQESSDKFNHNMIEFEAEEAKCKYLVTYSFIFSILTYIPSYIPYNEPP